MTVAELIEKLKDFDQEAEIKSKINLVLDGAGLLWQYLNFCFC